MEPTRTTQEHLLLDDAIEQVVRAFRRLIPRRVALRDAPGRAIAEDIEDEQTGQKLIEAWSVLRGAQIGLLDMIGRETVSVVPRPRVAILTGTPATVHALCTGTGAVVVGETTIGDDAAAISEWLNGVAQICDAIVVTAEPDGAAIEVLATEGWMRTLAPATEPSIEVSVARIAQTPVLALPADPARTAIAGHVFLQRALRSMAGLPVEPVVIRARLSARSAPPAGRTVLTPVRLIDGAAVPTQTGSTPTLTELNAADGIARIDATRRDEVVVELLT